MVLFNRLLSTGRSDRLKNSGRFESSIITVKKNIGPKGNGEGSDLNIIEKLQKEFRGLPIVTIIEDMVESASGMEKIEYLIRRYSCCPFLWLILAEVLRFRKEPFSVIDGLKPTFDLIETTDNNTFEACRGEVEKEKWTYELALLQAVKLGITLGEADITSLVAVGRSASLLKRRSKDSAEKMYYGDLGKEYLEHALEVCDECADKGEIFFYLADLFRDSEPCRFEEYLKLSIRMGFTPASQVLEKYYDEYGKSFFKCEVAVPDYVREITKFKYGYHKGILQDALNGAVKTALKQRKKIMGTSERIFDTIAEKFLYGCGKKKQ